MENKDSVLQPGREKPIPLEAARLQIGDMAQLQSQSNDERYSVRLIGLSKGRSVLVTAPMVDAKYLLNLRDGHAFVLRAFSGKRVFAFSTQIIKVVNTPYPYLHLAYPKNVTSLVVRKGARAIVNLICAITHCDDVPVEMAGTIINISISGVLIATKQPPGGKGQRIVVKFKVEVNGVEAILALKAVIRVVNVDPAEVDAPCQTGLQFVEVAPEDSIPLFAYVYRELLEQSVGGA